MDVDGSGTDDADARHGVKLSTRNYIATERPSFPIKVVVGGLIGIVVVLSVGIGIRSTYRDIQREAATESVAVVEGIERVRYYDEVLSMSARMAAATGQQRWIKRYERSTPRATKVSETLSRLDSVTTSSAVEQGARASEQLARIENEAIILVSGGRLAAAAALMDSQEYQDLETDYRDNLDAAFILLRVEADASQARADQWETSVILTSMLAVGIVFGLGVVIVRAVRRWATQLAAVTEQFNAELRRLAGQDDLTGLPNRRVFQEHFHEAHQRAERSQEALGIVMVDLDSFKAINDECGHAAGDSVLQEAGRRLASSAREVDTAARVGGDEFLVIVENIADEKALEVLAQRIRDSVDGPMSYRGQEILIQASLGTALVRPQDTPDIETLLHVADAAMYRDKARRAAD